MVNVGGIKSLGMGRKKSGRGRGRGGGGKMEGRRARGEGERDKRSGRKLKVDFLVRIQINALGSHHQNSRTCIICC